MSREPMHSKVKAGASGSVGGVAAAAIVIWVLGAFGVDTSGLPEWAVAVILSPVGALWAGWATPERVGSADKRLDR